MNPTAPHPTRWRVLLRGTFLLLLTGTALMAWQHPGLAAVRLGLAAFYALPAICLLPGVWRLQPRLLAASAFFVILLLMPVIAELWAEPQVRLLALVSCIAGTVYLVAVVRYIRRPSE